MVWLDRLGGDGMTFGNHGKGQVNGGLILTQGPTHLG
jgi:hypothetical protein